MARISCRDKEVNKNKLILYFSPGRERTKHGLVMVYHQLIYRNLKNTGCCAFANSISLRTKSQCSCRERRLGRDCEFRGHIHLGTPFGITRTHALSLFSFSLEIVNLCLILDLCFFLRSSFGLSLLEYVHVCFYLVILIIATLLLMTLRLLSVLTFIWVL